MLTMKGKGWCQPAKAPRHIQLLLPHQAATVADQQQLAVGRFV
jgi:hypothetical protein